MIFRSSGTSCLKNFCSGKAEGWNRFKGEGVFRKAAFAANQAAVFVFLVKDDLYVFRLVGKEIPNTNGALAVLTFFALKIKVGVTGGKGGELFPGKIGEVFRDLSSSFVVVLQVGVSVASVEIQNQKALTLFVFVAVGNGEGAECCFGIA